VSELRRSLEQAITGRWYYLCPYCRCSAAITDWVWPQKRERGGGGGGKNHSFSTPRPPPRNNAIGGQQLAMALLFLSQCHYYYYYYYYYYSKEDAMSKSEPTDRLRERAASSQTRLSWTALNVPEASYFAFSHSPQINIRPHRSSDWDRCKVVYRCGSFLINWAAKVVRWVI